MGVSSSALKKLESIRILGGVSFLLCAVFARRRAPSISNLSSRQPEENEVKRQEDKCLPQWHRRYTAIRGTPPTIDGDVFKDAWRSAPWSEPFLEIRGADAPDGTGPRPSQGTRMKMMWDDEFLYVAAILEYGIGDEVIAKFTERNSPIFHTDSDFEVFVDPAGCCHQYKELELNAINTVWNLLLTRPYADGGVEVSGRVGKEGEAEHWDVQNQRTATRILRGALGRDASCWCCELALAHTDTLARLPTHASAPVVGSSWRINFSRVEKCGQINWVWSPQVVWTPEESRYAGHVNMHLPDAYGHVIFADEAGLLDGGLPASAWQDPQWDVRHAAASLYYAAKAFKGKRGRSPATCEELLDSGLVDARAVRGLHLSLDTAGDEPVFRASCKNWVAKMSSDRLLQVVPAGHETEDELVAMRLEVAALKQLLCERNQEIEQLRTSSNHQTETKTALGPSYYEWNVSEEDFSAYPCTKFFESPEVTLKDHAHLKIRFWPNWEVAQERCAVKVLAPAGTQMRFKIYLNNEWQHGQLGPGADSFTGDSLSDARRVSVEVTGDESFYTQFSVSEIDWTECSLWLELDDA